MLRMERSIDWGDSAYYCLIPGLVLSSCKRRVMTNRLPKEYAHASWFACPSMAARTASTHSRMLGKPSGGIHREHMPRGHLMSAKNLVQSERELHCCWPADADEHVENFHDRIPANPLR